MNNVTGDAVN